MQSRYQIYIHYDGERYIANVPELDGCSGGGQSYAEALAEAEKKIYRWIFDAINNGKQIPVPSKDFVLRPKSQLSRVGSGAEIMQRLHHLYGNISNREIARIVCGEDVGSTALSSAVVGKGARWIRLSIADALKDMPDILWPHLSKTTLDRDIKYMKKLYLDAGVPLKVTKKHIKMNSNSLS